MIIIDATNLIVGRLASYVAKKALLGEEVHIINSEKAIISGKKENIFKKFEKRREIGDPHHGPYYPRKADILVRRIIRGMLPYKKERGKEAFKRIKCYIGVPKNLEGKKAETLKSAHVSKLPTLKYITIGELSKHLGAK